MPDEVTTMCLAKVRAEHPAEFAKYDDATLADLIDHMRIGENQKVVLKKFSLAGGKYGLLRAALGLPLKKPGNTEYNRAYRARKREEHRQKFGAKTSPEVRAKLAANLVLARAALAGKLAAKKGAPAEAPRAILGVTPEAPAVVKAKTPGWHLDEASAVIRENSPHSVVTIRLRGPTDEAARALRDVLQVLGDGGIIWL